MTEQEQIQLVTEGKNNEVLTTSKIVADNFGKRHRHVLEAIENILNNNDKPSDSNKAENWALSKMFIKGSYKVEGSLRSYPIYYMNRDGFSLLAMGFNGKKALQFKLKFIDAFNKMETQLKELSTPQIPKTLPEALRAYADQVEENAKLLEQNEAMQENYSFGTDLATSKDSEPVGNFAKQLNQKGVDTSQNKLFAWFRDKKYLMSAKGQRHNLPTQRAMDDGLFEIKSYVYYDKSKVKHTKYTTLVTVRGQKYFLDKFLHETK